MKHASHRIVLDNYNEFSLIGLGDIHYGSDDCSISHLQQAIQDILDTPNCYWLGTGDYLDFARTTFRKYLQGYTGDETTKRNLNSIAYSFEKDLVKRYLAKIKDKCLGIIEGNHTWVTEHGVSTGQRLSEMLDCPYLGDMGAITLHAYLLSKTVKSFRLISHHGDFGAAQTPGGDLNSLIKRGESWITDMTFCAHTHKKLAYSQPMLTWPIRGAFAIQEVPHVYVRTGGFQRVYRECDERGRYGEQKMFKPSDLGHVKVTFRFMQKFNNKDSWNVRVTQ